MLKIFHFSYAHERTSNFKKNVLRLRSSTIYLICAESKALGYTFAISEVYGNARHFVKMSALIRLDEFFV